MKILIYVWSLSNGGAERVASLWAHGFTSRCDDVCIMLGSFKSKKDYHVSEKIKIIRQSEIYNLWQRLLPLKIKKRFFSISLCDQIYNILPNFIKNWFTSRLIKKQHPDVIIVVSPGLFNRIHGALNICQYNIPVIVTDHNAYERPDSAPFSKSALQQKFHLCKKYDFLTVLTNADKRVLEKKMNNEFMKKVFALPNPLTFSPVEKIPKKNKVILAAGRMEIWHCKGFDLLLKAWAMVHDKFPEWKLKIAGGGDSFPMKKLCSELGIINRVIFLGFVDLKKQYEDAEIFVLSSRYEGFGMVLTEAMSQGCACIACDFRGRQREIIVDDSQGIICPTNDSKAIADALCEVISDEVYRKQLQKNAINRSKYYELPNIMKKWDEIFEKIGLN